MIPLIVAGLALVSLGATAFAYLMDQKSEEEVKRRKELRREHEAAMAGQTAERGDRIRAYVRDLAAEADCIATRRMEVRAALSGHVKELKSALKGDAFTPNRRRALTLLLRTMEEKLQQADHEQLYFDRLSVKLRAAARDLKDDQLIESHSQFDEGLLRFPEDWPSTGRVIPFMEGGDGEDNPFRPMRPALLVEGEECVADGTPVFVGPYDQRRKMFSVSASKALLREEVLATPGSGTFATVRRVEEKGAWLDVYGVRGFLPWNEQERSALVVGTELLVYPLEWKFDLSAIRFQPIPYFLTVTQHRASAMDENCFDSVPLLVHDDMSEAFAEHCRPVADSSDPWIIEPAAPDAPLNGRFVLRNRDVAIRACLDQHDGHHVIRVESLVPSTEIIPEQSIYCVLPVSLLQIDEGWFETASPPESVETSEQCQEFALFIHNEFVRQERLIASEVGRVYLKRWLDVARILVDAKAKADTGVGVRLLEIASQRPRAVEYRIDAWEKVERYINKCQDGGTARRAPEFMLLLGNVVVGTNAKITAEKLLKVRPAVANLVLAEDEPAEALFVARSHPHTDIQQMKALDLARRGEASNSTVLDAVLAPERVEPSSDILWDLTAVSREFTDGRPRALLEAALRERNLFCIQGPPGTGKTTLIVELIDQHLARFPADRILVASQANVAVDEVLTRLAIKRGAEALVRIGNPEKMSGQVTESGIDVGARHRQYQEELRAVDVPDRLKGMMQFWLEECGEELNADLVELLLTRHQIVGATCLGLTRRQLSLVRPFDLVVIDEAARATPGELLIPMLRGRKVVMIGDHKQLPPTIDPVFRDEGAPLAIGPVDIRRMYQETLFERLFTGLPPGMTGRLAMQYRMPPMIGRIVEDLFYHDEGLSTFKGDEPMLAFRRPLVWLDTSKVGGWHGEPPKSGQSLVNAAEVAIVAGILDVIAMAATSMTERPTIAIITCYSAQKRELEKRIKTPALPHGLKVEIDTVDSFQGNQADLVIFCTTRSRGSTRFLNDPNRLNVALSRTRREFLLIGSARLLCAPLRNGEINHFARLRDAMLPEKPIEARSIGEAVGAVLLAPAASVPAHREGIRELAEN